MPGLDALLQLGGPFALIGAIVIAAKYGVDAMNAWRAGRPTKVPQISDAATTNALLLSALKSERKNGEEKDRRISELETNVDSLRKMLYDQSDNYERELLDLRRQLEYVTVRLENMQARIRPHDHDQND